MHWFVSCLMRREEEKDRKQIVISHQCSCCFWEVNYSNEENRNSSHTVLLKILTKVIANTITLGRSRENNR